jgi:hypothetical protein
MSCKYKGCVFPTDDHLCRYHTRAESMARDNPYTYFGYGTGRHVERKQVSMRIERTHCRLGHPLPGKSGGECAVCRSNKDRERWHKKKRARDTVVSRA